VPGASEDLVSVRSPFRLASLPVPRNERFPDLGADTRVVLRDIGYTEEELRFLSAAGAFGPDGQDARVVGAS
jgi:crotonobetainyl-CoA:carnitine CoA-transferase CaiB-like acyl-CoA transferase